MLLATLAQWRRGLHIQGREGPREDFDDVPHRVQRFGKGEVIFHLMEPQTGLASYWRGESRHKKPFPNGIQMNVSRPSLHRELRRLESAGTIAYHPPTIEIHNAVELRDVLGR